MIEQRNTPEPVIKKDLGSALLVGAGFGLVGVVVALSGARRLYEMARDYWADNRQRYIDNGYSDKPLNLQYPRINYSASEWDDCEAEVEDERPVRSHYHYIRRGW